MTVGTTWEGIIEEKIASQKVIVIKWPQCSIEPPKKMSKNFSTQKA